jgi:transcription elongation GreA/GreB family factor
MSRAFVKEQDGNIAEDDVPERPQSPQPNYVTPLGLEMLRVQHRQLAQQHAQLNASGGAEARRTREYLEVERDLNFISGRLERAILVDPSGQPKDEVHFGAEVEVRDAAGQVQRFEIVGEDEADVASGKVSWASPLARAMIGAQVGDVVVWDRPAGRSTLEISAIRYRAV